MSNSTANIYQFWIEDVLLPQTPVSFTISNHNKNEEITLANGRPFTLPQLDGAQKFEFEFEFTTQDYSWQFTDTKEDIRFYTDFFWRIKDNRNPVNLTIIRSRGEPSTCVTVLLDDYSYTEDAENGNDYTFKLSFTEYHPQNNQELDVDIQHHLITAGNARGWVDEADKREISDAAEQAMKEEQERQEKEQKLAEKEEEAEKRKAENSDNSENTENTENTENGGS